MASNAKAKDLEIKLSELYSSKSILLIHKETVDFLVILCLMDLLKQVSLIKKKK